MALFKSKILCSIRKKLAKIRITNKLLKNYLYAYDVN